MLIGCDDGTLRIFMLAIPSTSAVIGSFFRAPSTNPLFEFHFLYLHVVAKATKYDARCQRKASVANKKHAPKGKLL
jgi:hypothetical protein